MTRRFIPNSAQQSRSAPETPSFLRYYSGRITLFNPTDEASAEYEYDPHMGWDDWAAEIELHDIPGIKL